MPRLLYLFVEHVVGDFNPLLHNFPPPLALPSKCVKFCSWIQREQIALAGWSAATSSHLVIEFFNAAREGSDLMGLEVQMVESLRSSLLFMKKLHIATMQNPSFDPFSPSLLFIISSQHFFFQFSFLLSFASRPFYLARNVWKEHKIFKIISGAFSLLPSAASLLWWFSEKSFLFNPILLFPNNTVRCVCSRKEPGRMKHLFI